MGDERDAFVARYSRRRLILFLLVSLGFAFLGLWLMGAFGELGEPVGRRRRIPPVAYPYIGALNAAFWGWAATVFAKMILSSRSALRIDAQGILEGQNAYGPFSWDDITEIRVVHSFVPVIAYELSPEFRRKLPLRKRLVAAFNRRTRGTSFAIAASTIDSDIRDVKSAIIRFAPKRLSQAID